jgi:hypothetical protein
MSIATPEWLSKRGGELKPNVQRNAWVVYFRGEPQYRLTPVPVTGKHGCQIMQTINSKRFDLQQAYTTPEEAVSAGLDAVKKLLGW